MPHYHPLWEPPSLIDRILAHSWTVVVALGAFLVGSLVMISALTGHDVSRGLSDLPRLVKFIGGLPLAAGAPYALIGVLKPASKTWKKTQAWSTERTGLVLLSIGFGLYWLNVAASTDGVSATATLLCIFSLACALSAVRLWVSIYRVRKNIATRRREGYIVSDHTGTIKVIPPND